VFSAVSPLVSSFACVSASAGAIVDIESGNPSTVSRPQTERVCANDSVIQLFAGCASTTAEACYPHSAEAIPAHLLGAARSVSIRLRDTGVNNCHPRETGDNAENGGGGGKRGGSFLGKIPYHSF
jgi:hypothetical protein